MFYDDLNNVSFKQALHIKNIDKPPFDVFQVELLVCLSASLILLKKYLTFFQIEQHSVHVYVTNLMNFVLIKKCLDAMTVPFQQ